MSVHSTQQSSSVSQDVPPCPSEADRLNDPDADSLSDKQLAAVELLVLGCSFGTVAKEVEVDRRTIYRWRLQPAFAEALEHRHEEAWIEARERLRAMVNRSLDVMEQHLANGYDRARFRAASAVLRLANIGKTLSAQ